MKPCVACGKKLPDGAINCVFCKARQHEERIDPTPVHGIRYDASPEQAVAEVEKQAAKEVKTPSPARAEAPVSRRGDGIAAAPVPQSVAEREDRSVLIQLGQWNRNERATLLVAGLALLAAVVGFRDLRTAIPIVTAIAILVAGAAPLPRTLRGVLAFAAGFTLLWRIWGPGVAGALPLLPGALLTRARNPASRLATLWGLVGAGALMVAYLVPHDGPSLARSILDGFKGEHFIQIATAIYLTLPIPLAVVGLLALTPSRTLGGCVLWATLMLLWAPVGLLLQGFWSSSVGASVGAAVIAFGASTAAALGLADLSSQ